MKIKVLKIMVTFILLVGVIMMGSYNVFAVKDPAEIVISDSVEGDEELEEIGEHVLGIVTVVGYAIAVVTSIIIGIKYMTGSVEEKAGYKKSMIPYIVGCLILVASTTLTNVVYEIAMVNGGPILEKENTAKILMVFYCDTCGGEVAGKGKSCSCSTPEAVKGYKCTGCEQRVYKQPGGRIYCINCGSELKNK